jgi:hypothetical protein
MPDLVSTRPSSGQPIATAWGDEVHDALEGIQAGSALATGSGATGSVVVTFPRPYAAAPVVVVSPQSSSGLWLAAVTSTPTTCTIYTSKRDGSSVTNLNVFWVAIGTPA